MKTLKPLYCILSLILAHSAVYADGLYKWKDARGNTQYGDRPPANANAKQIELPKITVIDNYANQWKPIKLDEPTNTIAKTSTTYSKLIFLAPKQSQGIRANDGDVSAIISIKPPLKKGHNLVFSIDGKPLSKGKARTQNFSNLDRGAHTIGIKVIDQKGKTLKSSSVGFNVLRVNSLSKDKSNQAPRTPQARSFNDARQQQIQNGS